MKKNVGSTDAIIRVVIAIIIAALIIAKVVTGTLAIVLGVVGVAAILTSFVRVCGLYSLLGINTCKTRK